MTDRLHLPYFVYGTLRPGYGNSELWRQWGAVGHHDGVAYVAGFQMFGSAIPFAVRSDNHEHRVYGAVIQPPDGEWEALMVRRSLDQLEGYPHGYDRLIATAHTPNGPAECWIYSPTSWRPQGDPEPSGNYDNMVLGTRRERNRV